ncbi:MAG TPA: hypothetical protein VGQ36_03525 [Thermoanaerobaculia bacterium]|jgi:hypothetical protein|nr:hypothetical protein [Thermoanaerobaculia bacterium]
MTTDAKPPFTAHAATIRVGSLSLILAAIAFFGVFLSGRSVQLPGRFWMDALRHRIFSDGMT